MEVFEAVPIDFVFAGLGLAGVALIFIFTIVGRASRRREEELLRQPAPPKKK